MTKRGRLVVAGAIVVLFGSVLLLELASRQTVTVRITDKGYEPESITIQQGQKVIWKNVGQLERWPASNSHPTHNDYPSAEKSCLGSQLDACKVLNNNEKYEFVFNSTGSWGIHDHLSPNQGMVVIVSDIGRGWFGKIKLIAQSVTSRPALTDGVTPETFRMLDYANQKTALEQISINDPKKAWELLKDAFIINGKVTRDVHEFAHLIGHAAYEKQGIPGVAICDASFAYGCFHGVAEDAIKKLGETAVPTIEQACTDNLDEQRRPSCYHGIGHGTAGIHKLQLEPALNACNRMQPANQSYCHDGVFMEHATAVQSAGISRDVPWSLCEGIDELYHVACARYQPVRLSNIGLDFAGGIISCNQTEFIQLREHCSRGFGYASVTQANYDPTAINTLCTSTSESQSANWCRIAAATELVFQKYAGWEQNSTALCALTEGEASRSECEYSINSIAN